MAAGGDGRKGREGKGNREQSKQIEAGGLGFSFWELPIRPDSVAKNVHIT